MWTESQSPQLSDMNVKNTLSVIRQGAFKCLKWGGGNKINTIFLFFFFAQATVRQKVLSWYVAGISCTSVADEIIILQDGVSCLYAKIVWNYLNGEFTNHWIGIE